MANKKAMRWLWTTLAILGIVGGVVHVLSGLGIYDLLALFGSWAKAVQVIAGVSGIVYIVKKRFLNGR